MAIENVYYSKRKRVPVSLDKVIDVFKKNNRKISSKSKTLISDEVLKKIQQDLKELGFRVETGKKKDEKITIPVLTDNQGKVKKYFDVDAYHEKKGIVIEVEAGRAVHNYQFLKDLFQACMMPGVKYLVIAVRNNYSGQKDFNKVSKFMETLYESDRLNLPLKGILIIGY